MINMKRFISSAALVTALAILPMSVSAAIDPQNDTTVAVGGCHCGGLRLESRVYNMVPAPGHCVEGHGPDCPNTYEIFPRIYHHCSNPACSDIWYTDLDSYYSDISG